jgi:hypothetical protein
MAATVGVSVQQKRDCEVRRWHPLCVLVRFFWIKNADARWAAEPKRWQRAQVGSWMLGFEIVKALYSHARITKTTDSSTSPFAQLKPVSRTVLANDLFWFLFFRQHYLFCTQVEARTPNRTKLCGLSPRANYTDKVTAARGRSKCQALRMGVSRGQRNRSPTAVFSHF